MKILPGRPDPPGATVTADGVNFSLYSASAAAVELLLFATPADALPAQTIVLDPARHRTYHYWHAFVPGARAGQLYGYRVHGPQPAGPGQRFDPDKLLLDPYARAVANDGGYRRHDAGAPGANTAHAFKSVAVDPEDYDWQGDTPLRDRVPNAPVYELHVAGFTRSPSSGVAPARRGTYAGLIEKIPYLVDLGVTAVELMPVQQFDAQAAPTLVNYWGYQPVAWFAPHAAYSSDRSPLGPVREFRDLVRALHRAGIEVILDVVFNHTAETGPDGPTLCLRGIDNPTYYLLEPADPARYVDDTGTGNTVNANHPVVRRMILDCLRHWVRELHVDGFRFDLAAALSRGEDGARLARPALLLDIEADPVLAGTRIIAEAWDAAGLYEVADFAGDRWAVWNGRFRDSVRRFVKGDGGTVGALADALVGSRSFFADPERAPGRSVNFVTAHDGYTLNDLVSYDAKHNEANGEDNRDGADDNASWNCGVEGPTADPAIAALRERQVRNFATILLLAQGRPMWLMGDELRRTQRGNNNAYCQDNEVSWLDWTGVEAHAGLLRFVRGLLHWRRATRLFRSPVFRGQPGGVAVRWHGVRLDAPDWSADSHSLACELFDAPDGAHLQLVINAYWEPLEFELPPLPDGQAWHRLVDTARPSPQDFCLPPLPPADVQATARAQPRSVLLFVALAAAA